MPKNKYSSIGEIDSSSSGYSPYEEMWQSTISQTPGVFDYAELDKKFPTRQVRPIVPPYIQQEIDEDRIARKAAIATQRMREAQASIYESQLNEDIQIAEQVKLAKEELSKLNPQDSDYLEKSDRVLINLPYAEKFQPFVKGIVERNYRIHEKAMERARPQTPEEQVEFRLKEAQAGIQEARLNEDIEMAKQMPEAQQYFLNLDPRSADYEEQRDLGFIKYPSVAGSVLEKGIISRMDRLNANWAKKNLSPDAARDKYQKAQKEKFAIQQLKSSGEIDETEANEYIGMLDQSINEARGQLGMPPIIKTLSFGTMQEAEEAERNNLLKKGDKVSIGGKTYIFE